MAQHFIRICSIARSYLLNNTRLALSSVKCYQTLTNSTHRIGIFPKSNVRPLILPSLINSSYRQVQTNVVETKTNVVNNVLLWKYENEKYFRNITIFSMVQFVFLTLTSFAMYTFLPIKTAAQSWKDYLLKSSILIFIIFMPIITAVLASVLIWFFVARSLKYIVLNKGGKMVTFISYHPVKGTWQIDAPLENIGITKTRKDTGQYMSVKIKNTPLFFLIDREGEYINPVLFDCTIGLKKPNNK